MAKFGAIKIPTDGFAAINFSNVAIRAASKPVVPTTAWIPLLARNSRLAITESGVVKSTTTCAPLDFKVSIELPRSSAATSSRSPASVTALTTSAPMRPFAPSTPTLIMTSTPSQISLRS